MNLSKLNEDVDWLKKQLGNGLLATDIWNEVGMSLAGYNEQREAVALFNDISRFIKRAIAESGGAVPGLGGYYMVELAGKKLAVVLIHEELQWGMLIDTTQASLDVIVSVVLPQAVRRLAEAASEGED